MARANRTLRHFPGPDDLADLITIWIAKSGLAACLYGGVVPRLLTEHNVRVPDLAVTCTPNQTEEAMLTDPVPLVDFLLPSDTTKTWTKAFRACGRFLVVRAGRIAAELFRAVAAGEWAERPIAITEGEVVLEGIGDSPLNQVLSLAVTA